jgi:hypothetical protein
MENFQYISIDPVPIKSNSSSGNWAVYTQIKIPIGTGQTQHVEYFFKKKDALEFIKKNEG